MKWMYKAVIGIILMIGIMPAQTILSVQPPDISDRNLMPGDTFVVDIHVENVLDLYLYQVVLQYKPDVLTIDTIIKGPFLSQGGNTIFGSKKRRRYGDIAITEGLMGIIPGVSGSGVLVKIYFRVNKRGKTYIDLSYQRCTYPDNGLINSDKDAIGFTTLNGKFSNE